MSLNALPVQIQSTTLYGAGATSGATTLQLSSFKDIDGTNLAMASFGSKGYITIEPNSGTQEEQIMFTGITQNADGTATLTGVSHVTFLTPFTETSGTTKSHPGGAIVVVSNTSGFYSHFVNKDDSGTINQVLTFASGATPAITDAPSGNTDAANKAYVDGVAVAGAPNANKTTKGIVQIGSQSQVNSKQATGGTGATLVPSLDTLSATKYNDYVLDTGTPTAYAIAPSPVITQFAAGLEFRFKAKSANGSGAVTLSVNGLATKSLKIQKQDPAAQYIRTSSIVGVVYDGTNFQITSVSRPHLSQEQLEIYGTSTTGNTTYAVALAPILTTYSPGLVVRFKPDTASSGGATLNVNGLGAKNIVRGGIITTGLTANDIPANAVVDVTYDGTQFQLLTPSSGTRKAVAKVSTFTTQVNTATNQNIFTEFIPGLVLGTNNAVKFRIGCPVMFVPGSNTCTFRLKYGSTVIATATLTAGTATNVSGSGWVEGVVVASGATNSQQGSLTAVLNQTATVAGGGFVSCIASTGTGTAAKDSTARQNFALEMQYSVGPGASAGNTCDVYVIETVQ